MKDEQDEQLFELGKTYMTQGVAELVETTGLNVAEYLDRHSKGDWGDLCDEDRELNDKAVKARERILSAYSTPFGKIYIVTEYSRDITTILLPREY